MDSIPQRLPLYKPCSVSSVQLSCSDPLLSTTTHYQAIPSHIQSIRYSIHTTPFHPSPYPRSTSHPSNNSSIRAAINPSPFKPSVNPSEPSSIHQTYPQPITMKPCINPSKPSSIRQAIPQSMQPSIHHHQTIHQFINPCIDLSIHLPTINPSTHPKHHRPNINRIFLPSEQNQELPIDLPVGLLCY